MSEIKAWAKQHPCWFAFIGGIIAFLIIHFGLHGEEKTASDCAKESVIDALGAATALAASVEQAATGNFFTGAGLFTLGAFEAEKAWNEAKQAWGQSEAGAGWMGTENEH